MRVSVMAGTLFLIPTPIGNFGDISRRAIETLKRVDLIAAEDTREAAKILRHLGIAKRTISYHDHNESARAPGLIERLKNGSDIALMSDAGTPLLSDPGFRLVTGAIAAGVRVTSLPGPSAVTTALAASGLPANRYYFVGYLPRKSSRRIAALSEISAIPDTLVAFEAPHRLLDTLKDIATELGDRRATIAWNLTKENECMFRGRISDLLQEFSSWDRVTGEITVVLAGADEPARSAQQGEVERAVRVMLDCGVSPKIVRDAVSEIWGLPRREVYRMILTLHREPS